MKWASMLLVSCWIPSPLSSLLILFLGVCIFINQKLYNCGKTLSLSSFEFTYYLKAAIGARTTESQIHRELASGMSMPVGFKVFINSMCLMF